MLLSVAKELGLSLGNCQRWCGNAGAKVTEEKSLAAGVLMNAFFLAGVFSFAVSAAAMRRAFMVQTGRKV